MKKINICILTNSKPTLFKRCINSINENIKFLNSIQRNAFNFIILCDDKSVNERQIKLNSDNLTFIEGVDKSNISENYKVLFEKSQELGENSFTIFVNDDDFLTTGSMQLMLEAVNQHRKESCDNYMFNYAHGYGKEFDKDFTNNFHFLKFNNHNGKIFQVKEFVKKYDDRNYQLGMLLFNNNSLDFNDFPKGEVFEDDYLLLELLTGSIKISSKKIFQQGFKEIEEPVKKPKIKSLNH